MSTEEYQLLLRRSRMFLDGVEDAYRRGHYDLAVFLAEQALQLYLKAQLLRTLGDYPRTRSIRQLLSLLSRAVGGEANRLAEFMRSERPRISELEDVYIASRYTLRTYTREDAEDIITTVKRLISLVEEVLRGTTRGPGGEG